MAWNPSPKVADLRELSRKWDTDMLVVFAISDTDRVEMVTYGRTKALCAEAKAVGDLLFDELTKGV